ncbi:hypothetical protein Fcan01_25227 [Folsomia candida]|uniref:Uncharacterized protein n=1 Tax=Folsomia candida TaxID=158441 RepID=A0A226D4R8_FOLCA|nr:hypothetical protein Fcan01_25227 [Folsomia candida]
MRRKREHEEFRRTEAAKNAVAQKLQRMDENLRQQEQQRDAAGRAERRKDSIYREAEKERDRIDHSTRRADEAYRDAQNERNRMEHATRRGNEDYRDAENERNRMEHATRREDETFKQAEQQQNTIKKAISRHKAQTNFDILCKSFHCEIPVYVKRTIRSLGSDRQYGIRGGVVNVPNDMDIVAKVIPRRFDETSTVQVQLKRRMTYKHPYMFQTIRPYKVFHAANYLVRTELYKKEKVFLSSDWANSVSTDTVEYIVNPSDATQSYTDIENIKDLSISDKAETEDNDPPLTETLMQEEAPWQWHLGKECARCLYLWISTPKSYLFHPFTAASNEN